MVHYRIQRVLNLSLCLVFLFSLVGVPPVQAGSLPEQNQSQPNPAMAAAPLAPAPTPPPPAGARLGYNSTTGRLNFVGGDAAAPLASAGDLSAMSARGAADGVLAQYAPQFGVANPAKDLRLARSSQDENGRVLRYQQQYQGVPIMGGELIVNSDTQGQVLSLNGEVSPDLALNTTTPAVSASQALQKALAGANSWYGLDAAQVIASQPALWIYDPRILQDDNQEPARLVWRIELSSNQAARPVNELVLVDVASGEIALHFSQVENFAAPQDDPPGDTPTPEALLTETPTATQAPAVEPTQEPSQTPTDVPPLPPAETPTDIPTLSPTGTALPQPTQTPGNDLQAQSGATWYVATTGSDSNDCAAAATPCSSINAAITKASDGDVVEIAVGTYTSTGSEVAKINRNIDLLGGWDDNFTAQTGFSTLDGKKQHPVVIIGTGDLSPSQPAVTATLERLMVVGGAQLTTTSNGSGVFEDANSTVTIRNSSINNNLAKNDMGSGLVAYMAASLKVINSTINYNQGGIYTSGVLNIEIRNATIAFNQSTPDIQTAGLEVNGSTQSTQLVLVNSIVANYAGSYPNNSCSFTNVTISIAGYNLITQCSGYPTALGDIIGKSPALGGLVPGGYLPLAYHSPAIDGGNPAPPGSGGGACEPIDQVGNPRPIDGNGDGNNMCDIGAYETPLLTPPTSTYIIITGNSSLTEPFHGGISSFSVYVRDQYGSGMYGVSVTFAAPVDGPSGRFWSTATQVTYTTDGAGRATAEGFKANGIAGKFHLTVSVLGGISTFYEIENYVPIATTLTWGSDSDMVFGRVSAGVLTIFAWDQYSRPMQGAEVTATAPDSGSSVIFTSSHSHVATSVSGADGKATFAATGNEINGTYSVTVARDGISQPVVFWLFNSNYFISPNGSDTIADQPNDCQSPDSPCLTLPDTGSSTLQDGSSFLLEKGIFPRNTIVNRLNRAGFSGGWDSTFTIQNGQTIIQGPAKVWGTAAFNNYARGVRIERMTFINADQGYGIANFTSATLSLEGVAASHNAYGFHNEGTATVINSTFSENIEGIANYGIMDLKNVTAARNSTGIYQDNSSSVHAYPNLTFQNSIISGNKYNNCDIGNGFGTSNGYNLFDTHYACVLEDDIVYGTYTSNSTDLIGFDPKLNQLIQNTYLPLLPGSPAIDAITGPGTYCPARDQRSIPRPSGSYCDIGAFEYVDLTPPYVPSVFSGSNQLTYPGIPYWDPIEVQVLDHYGTPVAGVTVTFAGPASGPSVIFKDSGTNVTTTVTDATGWVRVSDFSANLLPGEYVVTASVDLMAAPAEFHLNNSLAATYIDSTSGSDANACQSALTPCKTLDAAIKQTPDQGVIQIASGVLPLVSSPTKDGGGFVNRVYVNGGWNHAFTAQDGYSNLVGNNMDDGLVPHFYVNKNAIIRTNLIAIGGGGVINDGTLYFTNGMVTNNPKAIDNRATMEITNVTFTGNTCLPDFSPCGYARYTAGVISSYHSVLKLTNVTMVENYIFDRLSDRDTPIEAGAVVNENGTIYIQNSIIAWNLTDQRSDFSGNFISLGHNLLGSVYEDRFTPAEGDVYGTVSKPLDPKLADPADNGGGMLTAAPMLGSPAIGGGDPSACPKTDQRGVPRPAGQACTIGAYEGSVSFSDPPQPVIVFDARKTTDMPGYYICQTNSPGPACSAVIDPDVKAVYQTAIDFSSFLHTIYQRNGLDDARRAILASVHTKATQSAFWDGTFVALADSWPRAKDVVGHELSHGVIDYEGNLVYYYESGAITESLADLWGEYFDQTNHPGNDSSKVKWLIGQDAPGGAIRSMSNPPAHQQPDRMTSSLFYKGTNLYSGVQINSGVNNKAVYLMVDGGKFNGKTIAPLGWEKTGEIYYYTLGHLLTSGADYADLYMALDQACHTLVGTHGINLADCQQARNATDAVEMNKKPSGSYHFETANTCPTRMAKISPVLFFDDFENGNGKWVFGSFNGNNHWGVSPGIINFSYATSGTHEMFGNDYDNNKQPDNQSSDSFAAIRDNIAIPGDVNAYLYFNHAYGFEVGSGHNYDGGVLEYALDGSNMWNDASPLFDAGNSYNGKIAYDWSGNPLQGRKAYVGDSHGYISSRYKLDSMAGHVLRFRWRIGTGYAGYNLGWAVDDVEVYLCVGNPGVPSLVSPANKVLTSDYRPLLDWNNAANSVHYELQVATDDHFNNLAIDEKNVLVSTFPLEKDMADNTTFYWHVRAVNYIGGNSEWSSLYSFRTPMLPPVLTLPVDLDKPLTLRSTFEWEPVKTATSYVLQVSNTSSFSVNLINVNVTDPTFTPTSDLPAGKTVYWRVRALGYNPSAWSPSFSFKTPMPPSTPSLVSPAGKSLVNTYMPRLDWSTSSLPTGTNFAYYRLQIAADSGFTNLALDTQVKDGLIISEKTLENPLDPNGNYYWRVSAYNNDQQYSDWSAYRSFLTPMKPPELSQPANYTTADTTRPLFKWNSVSTATSYSLQVSTSSAFAALLVNANATATTYTPTVDMPRGLDIYWRVKANGANPSNWSDPFKFKGATPPAVPGLLTPTDNVTLSSLTPQLDWSDVPGADHYQIQMATSSQFDAASLVVDHTTANGEPSSFTPPTPLPANRTLYWRVNAYDAAGQYSNWSLVPQFHTRLPAPLLAKPDDTATISLPVRLEWAGVSESTGYRMQLSTSQSFSSIVVDKTVTPTAYTFTSGLTKGKVYFWRVQAKGTYPSGWSEIRSFTVQ